MCVDIDFRFLSDEKAEKISFETEKKVHVLVIKKNSELCCGCSVVDVYRDNNDDNKQSEPGMTKNSIKNL